MNKKLRYGLALVASVLLTNAVTQVARADQYVDGTFNFTVTTGGPTPTSSFVWDSTTNVWNSWTVVWDGVTFDFATAYNGIFALSDLNGIADPTGNWCGMGPAGIGTCATSGFSFSLHTGPEDTSLGPFTDPGAYAAGTYTITETTVPEPDSLALLAVGLLALGVGFKLSTRRHVD